MKKEEEIFQKHLLDLANLAFRRDIVTFTDYMDLNELNIFHTTVRKFPYIKWEIFGGYDFAERQLAAFLPDALSYEWNYPISYLEIKPLNEKFSDALSHRDYLGAILNLGIERPMIGDILVDEKCAYVFCVDHLSSFICEQLTRIRHTSVICREISPKAFSYTPRTEIIRGTVASVRLDSVLALAFGTSRSSLVGLIEGGKVFVNGKLVVSNGYSLKESDIVSARGYGKFRYMGMNTHTKKGRCLITIEKYI